MSLRTEFERSGTWLFCHRSFLPLVGLPIFVVGFSSFTHFANSHRLEQLWGMVCLLVAYSGLAVRALVAGYSPKGTSGRNTNRQLAQTLNATGIYSLVRHPLYLGNYLAVLGGAMFFHNWWIIILTTCVYALIYERIIFVEESFLRAQFGETFESWAEVTPAIIPRLRPWKPPALPFSWRTVLRREYTGFMLVTTGFSCFEIIGDSVAEGHLRIDWEWVALAVFGAAVYLTLRHLKKHTRLLHEKGR